MHLIVRSETGKGDVVSSGKRAKAGRESEREMLGRKEAGQGAAFPEQGRGTHEGFDAKSTQAKSLSTELRVVRRWNEHEDEDTKTKDGKRGEDRRIDNEHTGSDLSKAVSFERRNGHMNRREKKWGH
jgi:hypothetical protein